MVERDPPPNGKERANKFIAPMNATIRTRDATRPVVGFYYFFSVNFWLVGDVRVAKRRRAKVFVN
jgi:hypothetical protein